MQQPKAPMNFSPFFTRPLQTGQQAMIEAVLSRFPEHILSLMLEHGIKIVPLLEAEQYLHASAALQKRGINVDAWPIAPAGLFVCEERTLYLRNMEEITIGHEIGHAVDLCLGNGVYRSSYDVRIRRAFADTREFVNPYSATGLDEFMAEGIRHYYEFNSSTSPWPKATRQRLQERTPELFTIIEEFFTPPAVPAAIAC